MKKLENIFKNIEIAEKFGEEVRSIEIKIKRAYLQKEINAESDEEKENIKETYKEKLEMMKHNFVISQKQILRAQYEEEIEDIVISFMSYWIMAYEI